MDKLKKSKILKLTLGISIPVVAILSIHFGIIGYINASRYSDLKPKKFETKKYLFTSKITNLNEQAKKYYSKEENFIESSEFKKILENVTNQYKFIFNEKYGRCGWKGNQDKYITTYLKIKQKMFDEIFKNCIFSDKLPDKNNFSLRHLNSYKTIIYRNKIEQRGKIHFQNNNLSILRYLYENTWMKLNLDFNKKIGTFQIFNNLDLNIQIEFDIFVKD